MNYRVGDKVKVKKDLDMSKDYGEYNVIDYMLDFNGKVVTIYSVSDEYNYYTIKEDIMKFFWTDEMFEDLAEETQNKKEFKLTEEFMDNGAIHCNTKEEYNNMIEWFKNNNIEIEDEEREWDYENIYITDCDDNCLCVSASFYNNNRFNYDIVEWTDYMSQDIKPKEIETKTEDKKEITFEDINISNEGYELNCINKNILDRWIKENESDFLYLDTDNILYSDLPYLIKWLQDVYIYGQQVLEEEKKIEYVDFQTALEWMQQGNKAKIGEYIYYIKDDKFFTNNNGHISLSAVVYEDIISKEWILIKQNN